jgi:outer membrane receptor protein involved in Fe transport
MITGVALASAGYVHAAAADAADAAAAASSDTSVQELVVTGSRIPSKNLTSVSPVTSVDNKDIKLQGTTNVEDFLNNLPQVFADQGQYESNGATGIATVDLRNLGSQRTLVLIDGKRVQPGDPTTPVADINFIPPALIDRVEVLTGGASAVYGSDAISGVVNFILKKNFQGLEVDAQTSIAEHENNNQQVRKANNFGHSSFGFPLLDLPGGAAWTGQRHTVTITGGVNTPDDKGNVEFYLGYTSIDPVKESQFDYGVCSLSTNNTNTTQQYCGGSTTDATGRLRPLSGPNKGHDFDITLAPVGNTLAPFNINQAYNFAPLNYIQRPDTRYTAGFFGTYNINKAVNFYSSFMFLNDSSVAQIGPSGSFYSDDIFTIPCNDPLLSSAQANTLCGPNPTPGQTSTAYIGRRDIEGGPRIDAYTHTDFRIVIGTKGEVGDGWTYDLSAQWGQTNQTHTTSNYFFNSKLVNAIDVVPNPATGGVVGIATGAPVCASALPGGGDAACVPYNLWSGAPGAITPAQLAYLSGAAASTGETTEQVVTFSIANNLARYGIKSPYADDGVGVSFGAEYRREFLETTYDQPFTSGDLAGNGGATKDTAGSQIDKDVFAEIRAPLIQGKPYIEDFTFEAGYRFSQYSHGGTNSTYKFGVDYQVTPDIRGRASYERAVRAPNVQELFAPAIPGTVGATDPCAGGGPVYTAQQCYNTYVHTNAVYAGTPGYTPVTLAQFTSQIYGTIPQCISAQCGSFSGGNPNLTPEIADTKSLGFVFTPSFFRPFTLSLDYFDIEVNKAIISLPFATLVNACANTDPALAGASFACNSIVRDLSTSALYGGTGAGNVTPNSPNGAGFVNQQLVNGSSLKTSGFDIASAYRIHLPEWSGHDFGSLGFNYNGTYTEHLITTLPDGITSFDCAGLYGVTCGIPTPHYRHQVRFTWTTPWNLGISWNWRYVGPSSLDFNSNQTALHNGYTDLQATDAHISAYNYFDLAFTYKLKDRYTFRAGINNIFDTTPPLLDSNSFGISAPAAGNSNTYPQVYDPLGRVLYLGVTADF